MTKIVHKPITLPDPAGKLTKLNNWLVYNMEYNVTTCNTLAINEVLNAWSILLDHPKVCRHKIKVYGPEAADMAEQYQAVMLKYMNDPERMNTFTDGVVDVVADDMHMLRALIRKELSANGCREVELTTWVEVARIMLIIATNNFDVIIKSAKEMLSQQQLGMAVNIANIDYADHFSALRLTHLLKTWEKVADLLDPNAISIVSPPVEETLHRIGYDFANDVYADRCMRLMADRGDEFFREEVARRDAYRTEPLLE